ncbi:MAG: molybdopterin-dependent oxidoreductase [Alphaproteobacteria bacterium]
MRGFCLFLAFLCFQFDAGSNAMAGELPEPTGPEILVVDGAISVTNRGGTAVLDHRMLSDIDTNRFTTGNPWDGTVSTFEGIRLSRLLEALGASGSGQILVAALDGYVAEIPVSDFVQYEPMLAWSRDGERMTVRGKGPLWLVYPYDSFQELAGETYSARSVWQVERITVE